MKEKIFVISLLLSISIVSCNFSKKDINKTPENTEIAQDKEINENNQAETDNLTNESGKVIKINSEKFSELVYENENSIDFKGELPCIVDFYADWCRPCRELSPILDELAKEYEGKINIYKIDTDVESDLSAAYGVQSIPTLLFCTNSGEPIKKIGGFPKNELKQFIETILLK